MWTGFWVNNAWTDATKSRRKKTGQKAGFSFLEPELLGSVSSSTSSFASSGGSFASSSSSFSSGGSSVSSSFASFDSSFASFDSSFASFDSSFSSRCFDRRSSFFFLAASGHGNSQQSSQEDGIFHLISLKLQYIKTHTRDRSGTCDPADARILANRQKKTTIY